VNSLLALLDPCHVFHEAAHAWVEDEREPEWLTCPIVQNGVIRVASQSQYPNRLGTTADVREIVAAFCADPRHRFCPDDVSLLSPEDLVAPEVLTPSRVTDLYLLCLARRHGVRLATFDTRIPARAVPEGRRHLFLIPT